VVEEGEDLWFGENQGAIDERFANNLVYFISQSKLYTIPKQDRMRHRFVYSRLRF